MMKNIDPKNFEKELRNELRNSNQAGSNYSQEYRQFMSKQTSSKWNFYINLCKFSSKIIYPPISKKDNDKINKFLKILHYDLPPQAVFSLSYLFLFLSILAGLVFTVLFYSLYPLMISLVVALSLFYFLSKIPEIMFKSWRSKSSDQLVSAVLYMVIYMEHTSNLEQAVYFAAKNLPPPLSLDFMRILWLVESEDYSSISEALEDYVQRWAGWNDSFIDAIHILQSSLYVSSEDKRQEVLDRAVDTILRGTKHGMMKYAHDSQNPVQAIHMLGIVLPVMGLVMLPMIASFLGDVVSLWQIVLLYNVVLPLSVYFLIKNILNLRPSGINRSDIYDFYAYRGYNASLNIGKSKFKIRPSFAGFAVFLALITPSLLYFYNLYLSSGESMILMIGLKTLFMSVLAVVAIGFGLATYYYLRVKDLVPLQKYLDKVDRQFSSVIFQLGNQLEENIPVESAFKKIADRVPNSPVSHFFNKIYSNLINNQMSLKSAIFNKENGAISHINSSVIRGVMRIVVQGSKKSSRIVSFSLITVSKFLSSVREVNERMEDLLSETISSLRAESKIFIPIISGIVVAMAMLTTSILVRLSERLKDIGQAGGSGEQLGFGTTLLEIFKVEYLIPAWMFQLVVGIYLIQVTLLISYLLSGIVHGNNEIERYESTSKNLFIGTTLYVVVALIMSTVFVVLTKGMGATV